MLEVIDLSNPYICAAILLISLFFILLIFIRSKSKASCITQSLVYFGVILVFVLDTHNTLLTQKYIKGADEKDGEEIMKIASGLPDKRFIPQIYDI